MHLNTYLKKYSTLRNIKRFNMECTIRPQDLCGHGYSVGTLFYLLCQIQKIEVSAETLFRVMNHDFAETFTGDLNRRIKDMNDATKNSWSIIESEALTPSLKIYTDEGLTRYLCDQGDKVYETFALADNLDAYLYCKEEVSLGNSHLIEAKKIYLKKVCDLEDFLGLNEFCGEDWYGE